MAPSRKSRKSVTSEKFNFFCCKTKISKVCVCIMCGKTYHDSCVKGDWLENVKIIDDSRLICKECESKFPTAHNLNFDDNKESTLLRIVIKELMDKSNILVQYNVLLQEMLSNQRKTPEKIAEKVHIPETILISGNEDEIPTPIRADLATVSQRSNSITRAAGIDENLEAQIKPIDVTAEANAISNTEISEIPLTVEQRVISSAKAMVQAPGSKKEEEISNVNVNAKVNAEKQQVVVVYDANDGEIAENNCLNGEKWETPKRRRGFNRKTKPNPAQVVRNEPSKVNIVPRISTTRTQPKFGTNTTQTKLKMAQQQQEPPKEWIFLSGFDPDTNESDIMEFLTDYKLQSGCICHKMNTKSDNIKSSFRLGVRKDIADRIMSTELWPEGTLVNHFQNI